MKNYYRNPKTQDLIIYDSITNEIFILEKIKNIQVFLEDDLLHPIKKNDDQIIASSIQPIKKRAKPRRAKITSRTIEQIEQKRQQGLPNSQIAKELGIAITTLYKYLKLNPSL